MKYLWHRILHWTGWNGCTLESRWDSDEQRVYFRLRCVGCGKIVQDWHALRGTEGKWRAR